MGSPFYAILCKKVVNGRFSAGCNIEQTGGRGRCEMAKIEKIIRIEIAVRDQEKKMMRLKRYQKKCKAKKQ